MTLALLKTSSLSQFQLHWCDVFKPKFLDRRVVTDGSCISGSHNRHHRWLKDARPPSPRFAGSKRLRMIRLLTLSLMLALFAGCQPKQVSLNSDLAIGSTFPNIEGVDIDGAPISMSEFKGKVVLLDFFGDW